MLIAKKDERVSKRTYRSTRFKALVLVSTKYSCTKYSCITSASSFVLALVSRVRRPSHDPADLGAQWRGATFPSGQVHHAIHFQKAVMTLKHL